MRPWYLGLGALPGPYTDAVNTLQALSNANPAASSPGVFASSGSLSGTAELPGQVAYAISQLGQSVAQFSGGDAQAMANNSSYQTLLAQERAVISNGDFNPQGAGGQGSATSNAYSLKGGYNVTTVVTAANALIPFVNGLTGSGSSAGGGSNFTPLPNNGPFVPVNIMTAKKGQLANLTQPTATSSGGQVVGGPVAVIFPPISVGPSTAGAAAGPTPAPPGIAPIPSPPTGGGTTTVQTPNGPMTVPIGPPTVQTDPSTGATTTTVHNPDGSVTVSTTGGPGGEPKSVTYPPVGPAFGFFPAPHSEAGALVLALGVGAMAMGLIVLLVNSKEGEKALAVVAKPVDDAAKAVGIPDLPELIPDLSLPEFGPTLNPLPRRRRKGRRKLSKSEKSQVKKSAIAWNRRKAGRAAIVKYMKKRGYTDAEIKRSLRSSK